GERRPRSCRLRETRRASSLRGCLARASLLADAVRDDNPSRFLLLPHGHHVLWRRRERLRAGGSTGGDTIQSDGVGHYNGGSVQLGFQIAEGVVLYLPTVILLQRGGAIKRSAGGYARVIRSESALHLDPVRRLHIFPEDALQTLASGCLRQGARRMLAIKSAGRRKHQRESQHHNQRNRRRFDSCPRTHGVIVS